MLPLSENSQFSGKFASPQRSKKCFYLPKNDAAYTNPTPTTEEFVVGSKKTLGNFDFEPQL